jgi:hypothetical protein
LNRDLSVTYALKSTSYNNPPSSIPFQYQFHFTNKGAKYLRVISFQMPTTIQRGKAEYHMDVAMNAVAGLHRIAAIVESGDIAYASMQLRALYAMMQRSEKNNCQCEELSEFVEKTKELEREMRNYVEMNKLVAGKNAKDKEGKLAVAMSDHMAEAIHRATNANRTSFVSGARKKDICMRRKGDEELNKVYYEFTF